MITSRNFWRGAARNVFRMRAKLRDVVLAAGQAQQRQAAVVAQALELLERRRRAAEHRIERAAVEPMRADCFGEAAVNVLPVIHFLQLPGGFPRQE